MRRRRAACVVVIATLVVVAFLAFHRAGEGGIAVDYVAFATGGRLVAIAPHSLYNIPAQADVQAALLGYRPDGSGFPLPFVNPPFVAELMRPLAALPLQTGTDLFCAVMLVALFVAALMLKRRAAPWRGLDKWTLAVMAAVSTGGAYGVLIGQWSPLLEVVAVAALLLLDRERPVVAGAVLALLLVKPQIVWLLIPGLVLTRRWRLLGGFLAGAAVLGAVSLAIVGIDGAREYVAFIRDYAGAPAALTGRSVADYIARLAAMPSAVPAISAAVSVVALVGVCLARRHLRDDAVAVAVLLLLSLLASGHTNPEDFGVLCIAVAVFAPHAPRPVIALAVAANIGIVVALTWWAVPLDILTLLVAAALLADAARRRSVPGSAVRPTRVAPI